MLLAACGGSRSDAHESAEAWKDWNRFAEHYIQADGRLIDWTFEEKSTSEGQSYALFFSLVANDRARFDQVLRWTSENLAGNALGDKLPAWHWGRKDDGSWGVKDGNSAADGDLWTAYSLLEAARLWSAPEYEAIGRKLLAQVAAQEVVMGVVGGAVLLPAPYGFRIGEQRFKFDPCYVPPFQFRYFGTVDPKGPWLSILDGYMTRSAKIFHAGVAPDLITLYAGVGVEADPDRPTASYDAIRVYLWAGMSERDGPGQLQLLRPFAELIRKNGVPPEKVDTRTGQAVPQDWTPSGFMAASLPFLRALGEDDLRKQVQSRMERERSRAWAMNKANYYDEVLVLFGLGWIEKRFRFDREGRLQPAWAKQPAAG